MINMNQPVGQTPLDQTQGLVGQPLDRIDGSLKVTGRAPYAYEYREGGVPTYAFLVEAGIATGRLTRSTRPRPKRHPASFSC
jgi:xanthine dehydrogenase YagR molybdenum-binding subunit